MSITTITVCAIGAGSVALIVGFFRKPKAKEMVKGQPFTPVTVKGNTDLGTTQLSGTPPTDADKAKKLNS